MPKKNKNEIEISNAMDENVLNDNTSILDLDNDENSASEEKSVKKNISKRDSQKSNSVKKTKLTKSKAVKAKSTAKTKSKVSKNTKKNSSKQTRKRNDDISTYRSSSKKIEDELLKVTNIKSIEQIKKPRRIALMIAFYAVVVIGILTFILIRFSKPKKTNLLLEESINYEFLTEDTTSKRIVEESSSDKMEEESLETIDYRESSSERETKEATEKTTEKVTQKATEKVTEKTTEKVTEKKTERATEKKIEKTTERKTESTTESADISKRLMELTTKSADSYKLETVERETEPTMRAWPERRTIAEILPRYKDVLYSYPTFYQMSLSEIGVINTALTENYGIAKNKLWGEEISFANKGTNGLVYLNYTYLQQYIENYTSSVRQDYDKLKLAPYYNYIMNDKFHYDYKTYTTNLQLKLDFKNAKNQGMYYEIPAIIYEPAGTNVSSNGINRVDMRVLKKAKVGYTESFSLTSLLEVLDIECHTKHNPFFDIEDVIGMNPKAVSDMIGSGFDVRSLIEDEIFNYVLFDKKGYITALYMLKS